MNMDRREAIKRTAILMGGFAFAPNALGILSGCTPESGVVWHPQFFSTGQAKLVTILSDIIIPSGETPGAADVGVPAFIEKMVTTIYDEAARDKFVSGLESFNKLADGQAGSQAGVSSTGSQAMVHSGSHAGVPSSGRQVGYQAGGEFIDLDPETRYRFAADQNKLAVSSKNKMHPATEFFLIFKELTLLGYFTSEAGATRTLRYIAIPGKYDGCVPFDEIGKTWAT